MHEQDQHTDQIFAGHIHQIFIEGAFGTIAGYRWIDKAQNESLAADSYEAVSSAVAIEEPNREKLSNLRHRYHSD